jgi:uncharacterized membrane protein YcaP (DUF421 family)
MDTVIRIVVFYVVVWLGLRILGKREFSELSSLELITLLTVPEIMSPALTRGDYSVTNAVIGLATLFGLTFLNSLVTHQSKAAEEFIMGKPTVLIQHGKFVPENMDKERVSAEEINTEMHKSGLEEVSQVRWAILESDGKIAIIPENEGDRDKRKTDKQQVP